MRPAVVIVAAVINLLLTGSATAQGTGRSLDIQPGARENGMGAAGVALSGDPSNAVWWNPAALGFAEWYSGQWTLAQLVPGLASDVWYHHFSAAIPIKGFGGVGLGLTYLSYGESQGTDAAGNPTGSFTANELSPSLSVGYRPIKELAVGLTMKAIRIRLAPSSQSGTASTFGFDFGGLYRQTIADMTLSLGVSLQNVGPKVVFINEDQPSPLNRNLKVGGAFTAPVPLGSSGFEIGGTAVLDYNESQITTDFTTWNRGVEIYAAYEELVRVMYRFGHYQDDLGDINDSTHGFGVRFAGLTFDVGWIPQARGSGLDEVKKYTVGFHSDALSSLLAAQ